MGLWRIGYIMFLGSSSGYELISDENILSYDNMGPGLHRRKTLGINFYSF